MVGMIYERCHTRELAAYGGLAKILPVYSVFFMILTLAAIGLPTTSGFTGEFLVLLGAFNSAWPLHVAGNSVPLVMAAAWRSPVSCLERWYMLWFAAAVPVWRRQGSSCAPWSTSTRGSAPSWRRWWSRCLARALPAGGTAQDRGRRAPVPEMGRRRREARGADRPRG